VAFAGSGNPLSVVLPSALAGLSPCTSRLHLAFFQLSGWEGRVGWRKPLVFGISNAMVACSLKEAIRCQGLFSRGLLAHLAAWPTAVEVAAITLQAWRGQASHFNTSTPLDTCLYMVKLCGVCLLGAACLGSALGVLLQPKATAAKAIALHHGMLLLCVSVAVGAAQVLYGHFGLEGPREDEEDLCRMATAGASGSPCYEIHGRAVVKFAHFLPMHATEVLLLLSWSVVQSSRTLTPLLVRLGAGGFWGLAALGIAQVLRGESPKEPEGFALVVLLLSLACIVASFVMAFLAPWPLDSVLPVAPTKTAAPGNAQAAAPGCRSRSSRHQAVEAS